MAPYQLARAAAGLADLTIYTTARDSGGNYDIYIMQDDGRWLNARANSANAVTAIGSVSEGTSKYLPIVGLGGFFALVAVVAGFSGGAAVKLAGERGAVAT